MKNPTMYQRHRQHLLPIYSFRADMLVHHRHLLMMKRMKWLRTSSRRRPLLLRANTHPPPKGGEGEEDPPSDDNDASAASQSDNNNNKQQSLSIDDNKATMTKKKKRTKVPVDERQRQYRIRKYVDTLQCVSIPVVSHDGPHQNAYLELPSALLSKAARLNDQHNRVSKMMVNEFVTMASDLDIATASEQGRKPVIVLLLRSGRFAGACFRGNKCIIHRTSQRYTVRRGQGKAQSAQDGQRRPKSIGAQLRRAGEINLQEDVTSTILEWTSHFDKAGIILVSCPKTMMKGLFSSEIEHVLTRKDPRIRHIPLDLGRPSFENARMVYDVMMTATLREAIMEADQAAEEQDDSRNAKIGLLHRVESSDIANVGESADGIVASIALEVVPLTDLHVAAMNADADAIHRLLEESERSTDIVNAQAGENLMTPLHYASKAADINNKEADAERTTRSGDCVYHLLVEGKADPCCVDSRNRVPYFLASNEKVREAFRMARAALGEDYCDWDSGAKVGPPLTQDDVELRKQKQLEKKRRKRVRQKEKKAKEKALAKEEEDRKAREEEVKKQEADAKRIRDGLEPKTSSATNVCDYCQKLCKGRKRSQMYSRLEYVYCSTDCVQKHKRELMACAALSRFGG